MVRAPCCEKMGLKKGPWTPEEDQILINHIHLYGHSNWRALPKQAGLLRCGKSCRLRWTNYLRPDIKRGNFSKEEEVTIIKLHQTLGNRWSAIAARLPGRTDNEIKNVWHTHLKKRLKQNPTENNKQPCSIDATVLFNEDIKKEQGHVTSDDNPGDSSVSWYMDGHEDQIRVSYMKDPKITIKSKHLSSPQQSDSDLSTFTTGDISNNDNKYMKVDLEEDFLELDENFWSEVLSADQSGMASDLQGVGTDPELDKFPFSTVAAMEYLPVDVYNSNVCDNTDFWYSLFTRAGELPE